MSHFKFKRIEQSILSSTYLIPNGYLSVFFKAIPVPRPRHATNGRQYGTGYSTFRPGVYLNQESAQYPLPGNSKQRIKSTDILICNT